MTLRSLLCFTRILPAYTLCHGRKNEGIDNDAAYAGMVRLGPGNGPTAEGTSAPRRRWRFQAEASLAVPARAVPGQELGNPQEFASLQSSIGTLRLSVSQRRDTGSGLASAVGSLSSPLQNSSAFGAATADGIEVAEGYFGETCSAASPSSSNTNRLGKITEESATRGTSGRVSPPSVPMGGLYNRARLSSGDSTGSTASSRRHSVEDYAVILGTTPPLAAAVAGMGPPPVTLGPPFYASHESSNRGSERSSPSITPHVSPKVGPVADPIATFVTPIAAQTLVSPAGRQCATTGSRAATPTALRMCSPAEACRPRPAGASDRRTARMQNLRCAYLA